MTEHVFWSVRSGSGEAEDAVMRWVGLGADALLVCIGVLQLLYAYRLIGKRPGVDSQYDAVMSRQSGRYKIIGWCIIAMAVIGLFNDLVTRFLP